MKMTTILVIEVVALIAIVFATAGDYQGITMNKLNMFAQIAEMSLFHHF